jgi:hypothetical protein
MRTERDIAGGLVLLVGLGFALVGAAAHAVGNGCEWVAVWIAERVVARG